MASFSPKAFMHKVGPSRLDRYFDAHPPAPKLLPHLPLSERHYRALTTLPEPARTAHLATFARIRELTTDAARYALHHGARAVWGADAPCTLAARELTPHELAMDLFLDAPTGFALAEEIYASDSLTEVFTFRGWRRAANDVACSHDQKTAFRARIAPLLAARALGGRVLVEDHDLDDRVVLFVYFEDGVQATDVLVGAPESPVLETRATRPVLAIALVYRRDDGRLKIHAPGPSLRLAEAARDAFAEVYVGVPGFFVRADAGLEFDFGPIAAGASAFRACEHPLREAVVTSLTLRVPGNETGLITVQPRGELHAFLRAHVRCDATAWRIESVRLRVRLAHAHGERHRTVMLRRPNVSNLRDDARDRLIEQHLVRWGLVRTEPGGDDARVAAAHDGGDDAAERLPARVA